MFVALLFPLLCAVAPHARAADSYTPCPAPVTGDEFATEGVATCVWFTDGNISNGGYCDAQICDVCSEFARTVAADATDLSATIAVSCLEQWSTGVSGVYAEGTVCFANYLERIGCSANSACARTASSHIARGEQYCNFLSEDYCSGYPEAPCT